jgi:hypothetical protein
VFQAFVLAAEASLKNSAIFSAVKSVMSFAPVAYIGLVAQFIMRCIKTTVNIPDMN